MQEEVGGLKKAKVASDRWIAALKTEVEVLKVWS